jgi:hypothetical protein
MVFNRVSRVVVSMIGKPEASSEKEGVLVGVLTDVEGVTVGDVGVDSVTEELQAREINNNTNNHIRNFE